MPTYPAASRPTSSGKPLPTMPHPPKRESTAPLPSNFVPPSHHSCVSLRVFFIVSTLHTKSGWPVALPASGRSHSPSSWLGFVSAHRFQSFALWTFASEELAVISAVSVCKMGQPSALATFPLLLPRAIAINYLLSHSTAVCILSCPRIYVVYSKCMYVCTGRTIHTVPFIQYGRTRTVEIYTIHV